MYPKQFLKAILGAVFCLAGALSSVPATAADSPPASGDAACLACHDAKKTIKVSNEDGDERALRGVDPAKHGASVHRGLSCVSCHSDLTVTGDAKAPHKKNGQAAPDCATCHQRLWDEAQKNGSASSRPRMGKVVSNIAAYKKSFHAKPDDDNPNVPKASCTQCHDTHTFNVPADRSSPEYAAWRAGVPALCGASCHTDQLDTYTESAHGKEVLEKHNSKAAVCIDCHTTHEITSTSLTSFKLLNVEECGNCHQEQRKTYGGTYHGQATNLGTAETAKCYNCHGSHDILGPKDPASKVHPDNRLKTCQACHDGKKRPLATAGFASFEPHANSHDFAKYPEMWIVTNFMVALLIGVFLFFWSHSGLWLFREWKESAKHKVETHIRLEGLAEPLQHKHFRRFPVGWRIAHLCFALVTMTLVLTGTAVLFSHASWAPHVAKVFGGSKPMGFIHRCAAMAFVGIFFIHFVYVMQKLLRDRSFRWFGPDSLIPNWKDLQDCIGMFKWFFGKGPKPKFDRWTYFEKFDYWAVFWGVNIIGFSGLTLALPTVAAKFLPGWIFNVATVIHGEEAFLAAVFLFTVHFFNNHFRPNKLPPPDIVMFTGTQSLEEFRDEHPAQYERLLASGELQKYLVDAPSKPMRIGSKVLGLVLIAFGLILLTLVTIGFFTGGH
ncbi:cytochrome C [Pseudoduganella sp. FT26W]|uniref:Cytochrome C n=1 Tax=Duganella aquatilis TaxID=2666082 RepID=A0A844DDK4_9BURK|nr:cytochrome C [Duganella aquatilis]MRW86686.1 cytochrome C [Duganella aquatilis]